MEGAPHFPCEAEAALGEYFIYLTLTLLFQSSIADKKVSSSPLIQY